MDPEPTTSPAVIRLTVQGRGAFVPTVHVGGRLVRVRNGTQDVPVPAGRTLVQAHVTAWSDYGHAELEVDVAPGAVATVHYAAPWHAAMPGSMGTGPQTRRGRWVIAPAMAILLATPLVVVLSLLLR